MRDPGNEVGIRLESGSCTPFFSHRFFFLGKFISPFNFQPHTANSPFLLSHITKSREGEKF